MSKKTVVGGLGELANVMAITSQSSSQVRFLLGRETCLSQICLKTQSFCKTWHCYIRQKLHKLWMLSNTQCDNADASVIEDPYPIWQPPRQPNFYRARYVTNATTIGMVLFMHNHLCLITMLSVIGRQSISIAALALGSIFQSFGTLSVRISEQVSLYSPQRAQCCHIRVARDSSVARSTRDTCVRGETNVAVNKP